MKDGGQVVDIYLLVLLYHNIQYLSIVPALYFVILEWATEYLHLVSFKLLDILGK